MICTGLIGVPAILLLAIKEIFYRTTNVTIIESYFPGTMMLCTFIGVVEEIALISHLKSLKGGESAMIAMGPLIVLAPICCLIAGIIVSCFYAYRKRPIFKTHLDSEKTPNK